MHVVIGAGAVGQRLPAVVTAKQPVYGDGLLWRVIGQRPVMLSRRALVMVDSHSLAPLR